MISLLLAQVITTAPLSPQALQSAVQSALTDCGVPPSDTLAGQPGTGVKCVPRIDTSRPTVVQAAQTTTDASAAWSVTWAKPFVSATPYVHAEPIAPGLPMSCTTTSATSISASGHCYQSTTTTVGGAVQGVQSTVVSPFINAAAGIDIRVIGRETTQ